MKRRIVSAQSTLEYAVIIAVVAAVLTGMRFYFQRGLQSAIKVAADQIGTQEDGESIDTSDGVKTIEGSAQLMETSTSGTETEQVSLGSSRSRVFSSTTTSKGTSLSTSQEEE